MSSSIPESSDILACLKRHAGALEFEFEQLRLRYGQQVYYIQHPDGRYIAGDILSALVMARSAIVQLELARNT